MNTYNPYTYNPKLSDYFVTGNTGNLDMPSSSRQLMEANPAVATHVNSMWGFISWLQRSTPELYNVITSRNPQLLDPATVVSSGALSPNQRTRKDRSFAPSRGMSGLSDIPQDVFITVDSAGNTAPAPTTVTEPVTSWGQSILDTLKTTAPAYFQLRSQNDLMKINITRAEQGLPPIDSSALAPTVNVGVSPAVTQMGYIAIGGLMLFGLMSVLKGRKS